jgi:hypothetical protein
VIVPAPPSAIGVVPRAVIALAVEQRHARDILAQHEMALAHGQVVCASCGPAYGWPCSRYDGAARVLSAASDHVPQRCRYRQ